MKVNVSAAAAIATIICFSSHGVFAQQTLQKPTSQFPWNEAYPQPGVVPQPKPEWLQLLKNETIPKAPVNQAGPGGAFLQRTKNIELQCFGTKPQETNRRCALFFFFFQEASLIRTLLAKILTAPGRLQHANAPQTFTLANRDTGAL